MHHATRVYPPALLFILAACSSTSGTNSSPSPPTTTQHLYVGEDDIPGSILVYALPLTATSTPTATIPLNASVALGVNATTLAATRIDNYTISLFSLPVTSSSVPYATISSTTVGTPLLLTSGKLYQGGSNLIHVYTPPFTNASVPSGSIATPLMAPGRLAVDPNGNVYATTGTTNGIAVIVNGALTTTLTAPPSTEFRGLAASSTQLFACETTGSANHVFIYTLPLTANATPAITMNPNVSQSADCALDSDGNLYIGGGGSVVEYSPPFSATSARVVTLTIPGSVQGIAVGP